MHLRPSPTTSLTTLNWPERADLLRWCDNLKRGSDTIAEMLYPMPERPPNFQRLHLTKAQALAMPSPSLARPAGAPLFASC
jgi:hypothetical protein